ncbi:unnamed protein product [Rotaria magnacalcarata]|uniref:Uncharacterized protein n=1 Tax=Rotaria magnacalcarata TaxID=392030 RepID=A0A816NWD9_9BILA|nr:unnamed protein product [Rotaria magnacalcarata]CAF4164518.1 unnamed protein product [Rotaria magnacalcarata]
MASRSPNKIFVGPTPTTLIERALLNYFGRFGTIDTLELVDMSSLPSVSSNNYLKSATGIFVRIHYYIITFSSVIPSVATDELNKEWHVIDNHLLQVRQVELRSVDAQARYPETTEAWNTTLTSLNRPESSPLNPPNPLSGNIFNVSRSIPQVSTVKSTATGITISVTPAWFEETAVTTSIRYPPIVTATSDKEVRRPFDILAKYRAVRDGQHKKQIDFVAEPFIPNVDSTETLIVVLDMLAQSKGIQTSFTSTPCTFKSSIDSAACGIVNLSTMPLFSLAEDGPLSTATFNLKLNLSYEDVTSTENTMRNFVVSFINDIAKTFSCKPDYTQDLAKKFVEEATKPFSVDLLVLSKTAPAHYPIQWEQIPSTLQLQPSDFEPSHDRDYRNCPVSDSVQQRGNRPYYRPIDWYRHALRVIDKYSDDKPWLGMNNGPGEWPVAYHGTKKEFVSPIIKGGLKAAGADFYKYKAMEEKGPQAEHGIYLATYCNKGSDSERYAASFTVKMLPGTPFKEETYKVVFQCRFNPKTFTEHDWALESNDDPLRKEIRVYKMDGVRPYGILLKKCISVDPCNLTGVWTCDDAQHNVKDAGTYFIGQFDEHVFCYGTINKNERKLIIQWGDLPLGHCRLSGKLILGISSDYKSMTKLEGSDKIFAGTDFRKTSEEYVGKFEIDTSMKWATADNEMGGCWKGDDGARYIIATFQNQIYWLAIDEAIRRSHVGVGTVNGSILTIKWGDIISDQERFHGEIECRIESPDRIIIVKCICGQFSTKELTQIRSS